MNLFFVFDILSFHFFKKRASKTKPMKDDLANFRPAVLAHSSKRECFFESGQCLRVASPGRAAMENPPFFTRRSLSSKKHWQNFRSRGFNLWGNFGVASGSRHA